MQQKEFHYPNGKPKLVSPLTHHSVTAPSKSTISPPPARSLSHFMTAAIACVPLSGKTLHSSYGSSSSAPAHSQQNIVKRTNGAVVARTESRDHAMWQESMYRCLIDMAAGMDYLHSLGVINGDLKPANVLLKSTNADSRGFTCKVCARSNTASSLVCKTPKAFLLHA